MVDQCQERLAGCVNADIIIFNSYSDTVCQKFKFLYKTRTDCFQSHPFLGEQYLFYQENVGCISQRDVVTFLMCGGQMHNQLFQIYSGFYVQKIIKIGSFLTELFKKWVFFGTQCIYHLIILTC